MAVKSKAQIAKQEAKWNKEKKEIQFKKIKEYNALDEVTKIEYEIAKYETQIKNCNYDLQRAFKKNEVIEAKRDCLLEKQNQLKRELEKLKNANSL